MVTDLRVPSCPGADFAGVCPPALMVPTFHSVSSGRLFQWIDALGREDDEWIKEDVKDVRLSVEGADVEINKVIL